MENVFQRFEANETSLVNTTLQIYAGLKYLLTNTLSEPTAVDPEVHEVEFLARDGIHTWPLGLTSVSHPYHPFSRLKHDEMTNQGLSLAKNILQHSFGHMNIEFLKYVQETPGTFEPVGFWANSDALPPMMGGPPDSTSAEVNIEFWTLIRSRLQDDPFLLRLRLEPEEYMANLPCHESELQYFEQNDEWIRNAAANETLVYRIANRGLDSVSIDLDRAFHAPTPPVAPRGPAAVVSEDLSRLQDVEIVIIRPNIEHNMLGVIMGLGGESLGNTLWGQTELSVYDDSMHGIWGMSYKYHERAIVFNEKNLIRLWDIAYDGYNGGKDDTYVDWLNPEAPNGYQNFKELTLDVSKNYRGPSMMVMAFVHDREKRDGDGISLYDKHFRRNWPSPIVFHDSRAGAHAHGSQKESLPVDYDNLQVIDVDEFRVFNNSLYADSYGQYRSMMPHFHEMHLMRKTAGQSSADSETHTDSLAFQGSMKIKQGGTILQEIHGSGHHGPDYTGIASVRAGKGQKTAGQAPTLHRLI